MPKRTICGAWIKFAFFGPLLQFSSGGFNEGDYDMHTKTGKGVDEICKNAWASGSGSKGWDELEDGKELHQIGRENGGKEGVEVAADAQRCV
jgi:hypothetical protein